MPNVNQKKISRRVLIKKATLKAIKDRFYILGILFLAVGILVLDYSYIEPKPYKDFVIHNVFTVNITRNTEFNSKGFAVGYPFSSNISFSDPNGTPFTYRLYYMASYSSNGQIITKNQTFQNGTVHQENYTTPINTYGPSYSLSLEISTNAPHLHIVVTELSWYVTRNQSNLFLDEIGTSFLIAGFVTMVARLTYNTSALTKERKLAAGGTGNKIREQ